MKNGLSILATTVLTAPGLLAQETVEQRLERLEAQNRALQERMAALSTDFERLDLGGIVPPLGAAKHGVGQGAAKVYDVQQGLSIGGYGEFLFQQRSGRSDLADALRSVLYIGYKFDEQWVFNSEIEVEHGTTADNSGEVSLEFGYLDYLASDAFNLRGGMLLSPMGLLNELHEPTAFLPASRPQTETRIIPSTWRELGFGAYGDLGDFSYRSYLMTSLDGDGFGASGLRGGRQKGSRAEADDWSLVTKVDHVGVAGLIVGGSFSYGDSGQDNLRGTNPPIRIPDLRTAIVESHVDYRTGPWQLRVLWAQARLQEAGEFNTATNVGLAEQMVGYYGEVGCDVLSWLRPNASAQLTPFLRYEQIDTQERVPSGTARDASQEDEIWTLGMNFKPVRQVVIKLDYEHWNEDFDRFNVMVGYVF